MIKMPIKYRDLDDNVLVEDFSFHISKKDVIKAEVTWKPDGFMGYLKKVTDSAASEDPDGDLIMEAFEKLIRMSVGIRHEDGKQFIQTAEVRDAFMNSDAYSELFMTLCTDADKGAEFMRGILPKDIQDAAAADPDGTLPDWFKENRDPTAEELKNAPREHLLLAMKRRSPEANAEPETAAAPSTE